MSFDLRGAVVPDPGERPVPRDALGLLVVALAIHALELGRESLDLGLDRSAVPLIANVAAQLTLEGTQLSFSLHDLRHRRVSLLHLGGMPWARIGELVGHDDLMTTARTYTHVVADEGELDYENVLRLEEAN